MASLIVAGDTSGSITISAPLVAGSGVLTLPTGTDTLIGKATTDTLTNKSIAATQLTGTIAAAALPAGTVLQVVNASTSTQVSSASTARVDTGLTATITPTKNTSTILVVTSCRIYCATSSVGVCSSNVQLLRGATTLQTRNRYGLPDVINVGAGDQFSTSYLDSPATTSATTYKVTFNRGNGNAAVYAQLDSDMSTITLMEIQG
jgi:hypothetical protein